MVGLVRHGGPRNYFHRCGVSLLWVSDPRLPLRSLNRTVTCRRSLPDLERAPGTPLHPPAGRTRRRNETRRDFRRGTSSEFSPQRVGVGRWFILLVGKVESPHRASPTAGMVLRLSRGNTYRRGRINL